MEATQDRTIDARRPTTAQRIRRLLAQDDNGGTIGGLYQGEPNPRGGLTDFEDTLAVWGFVYGLAVALERLEDPFESGQRVADRAYEAAWPEFLRYNGAYKLPDHDECVQKLDRAWEAAHEALIRSGDSSARLTVTPELEQAINQVIGSMRRGESD